MLVIYQGLFMKSTELSEDQQSPRGGDFHFMGAFRRFHDSYGITFLKLVFKRSYKEHG